MINPTARHIDSSSARPRLAAVKWSVPSSEPDTTDVDDSWFEEAPRHSFIAFKGAHPFSATVAAERAAVAPASTPLAYDVWESAHAILVLVDLPGIEAEHVALSLGSQALHLELSSPVLVDARPAVPCGAHEVKIEAPLGSGPDSIDASLSNGLLRIRIVKESAGTRRVAIVANLESD